MESVNTEITNREASLLIFNQSCEEERQKFKLVDLPFVDTIVSHFIKSDINSILTKYKNQIIALEKSKQSHSQISAQDSSQFK